MQLINYVLLFFCFNRQNQYLHWTIKEEDVTAWPNSLMARHVYVPESSGLTYFIFKATYPKSCIVVSRLAERK